MEEKKKSNFKRIQANTYKVLVLKKTNCVMGRKRFFYNFL